MNSITKLQPATAFRNISLSPDFSGLALIKKKKRINVTKQKNVEKKKSSINSNWHILSNPEEENPDSKFTHFLA